MADADADADADERRGHAPVQRFHNATQRRLMAGFSAGGAVLVLPALFDRGAAGADRWFGLLLVLILLGATARALVASSVAVGGSNVVVRTMFRTRSYAYVQLRTCRAEPTTVGLVGYRRFALAVELLDGRRVRFIELSAKGSAGETWVDEAARIVNDRIDHASTALRQGS